ncbi:MAG: efflux RND transporter permease subunit [Bacteroidaceae bacterium]|nr:efflux RND transporter permease subunit [Bacteroidaceae bacterium]
MLRTLIRRPIAVTMVLIALVAVGILALTYIPVSLMPEIDIPRIMVQMSNPGASVSEVEQQMVTPMRYQLSQVAGLKDIETVSRMDAGTITLYFEPGTDMDLLFIDVNEKIDRAMNSMPKDMERPKVVKASAMDIPAFYVDMVEQEGNIASLSKLVRNVIAKRIEQLPQTAMVDYSGTVGTELLCIPDLNKLESLGLSTRTIEAAINDNNIVLEALSVRDGIYRYSIHFDSQILGKDDIENIYLQHEGRMLQLKDICEVEEKPAVRNGIVRHDGKDAITLAVIKQNDAQMADLQESMEALIEDLHKDYPDVEFHITRDQTQLLTYSINNLEWNLILGALLACVILFVFNGGWRTPLLIIISIPLSLILTLLCFYVMGISINVISLSGLILGVGMIVDNAIIVIDNIRQRGDVIRGTKEVFMPMLSSVLTTCSVFIPLIFLSGTAGALFYDQAMGVTIALFASLIVAVIVVPVYYYNLNHHVNDNLNHNHNCQLSTVNSQLLLRVYEPAMRWTLRHAKWCLGGAGLALVTIIILFPFIQKERMPQMEQVDAMMTVDWNAGISAEENNRRIQELMNVVKPSLETNTTMVGAQEFILSHTKDITGSEAVVYLKAHTQEGLDSVKNALYRYVEKHEPKAKVEFDISGNLYDIIFQTDKPDLEIHLQRTEGGRPSVAEARKWVDSLRCRFPLVEIPPVATEENLQYTADPERLAYYHVTYRQVFGRLKELVGSNKVYEIANGAQNVPVIIGGRNLNDNANDNLNCQLSTEDVMQQVIVNNEGVEIPLSYLMEMHRVENFKRLCAGEEGEYYPITIEKASDDEVKEMVAYCRQLSTRNNKVRCSFHGNYFDSMEMIRELVMVLIVAVLLLYFILAAQFENLLQPAIILTEIIIDVSVVMMVLWMTGESLTIMSMIGLVVMSGIIINDSILKVDTINKLYRSGVPLLKAVWTAGHRRLKPIVMTSLTTILALLPFLHKGDMGSAMQFPLSLTLIIGMIVGTLVSLLFVPLVYWVVYGRLKFRV